MSVVQTARKDKSRPARMPCVRTPAYPFTISLQRSGETCYRYRLVFFYRLGQASVEVLAHIGSPFAISCPLDDPIAFSIVNTYQVV